MPVSNQSHWITFLFQGRGNTLLGIHAAAVSQLQWHLAMLYENKIQHTCEKESSNPTLQLLPLLSRRAQPA